MVARYPVKIRWCISRNGLHLHLVFEGLWWCLVLRAIPTCTHTNLADLVNPPLKRQIFNPSGCPHLKCTVVNSVYCNFSKEFHTTHRKRLWKPMDTIIRPHHRQMPDTFSSEGAIHFIPLDGRASRNTARIYWSPLHTFRGDAVGMLRRTVWDRENIVSSTWWIAEPLVLAPWKVDPKEISHFLCKSAVSL